MLCMVKFKASEHVWNGEAVLICKWGSEPAKSNGALGVIGHSQRDAGPGGDPAGFGTDRRSVREAGCCKVGAGRPLWVWENMTRVRDGNTGDVGI